jgi:hypothetical protein
MHARYPSALNAALTAAAFLGRIEHRPVVERQSSSEGESGVAGDTADIGPDPGPKRPDEEDEDDDTCDICGLPEEECMCDEGEDEE